MMFGDKVYTLSLGESFVHDGFVAQALKAIKGACDNAANSEDHRLKASLMAAYLDLNTEPGKMSALHVVVRGQLSSMVLGDVNRRLSMSHASRTSALGAGDKLWAGFVGWKEQAESNGANGGEMVRMIPMLDESEAAATRRAVVNGSVQWSILDKGVEMGGERGRWQLDEIVRPEAGGTETCEVCRRREVAGHGGHQVSRGAR
jgi:hypothetical protein